MYNFIIRGLIAAGLLLSINSVLAQDLTGVWSRQGSTFNGGPQSQWSDGELPFTAAGREQFDNNISGKGPRQVMPAFGNDPLSTANPPGLYRTLVYGRPMEFIQLENKVVQIFEWGKHWRTIWTDGRDVPDSLLAGPFWYGFSVGEWQGDTLVVQTVGLDGRAWLDEWGTPFTDFTQIEERWTLADNDTIEMTITVTDPDLYTRPWTSNVKMYNKQDPNTLNGELQEQIFAPMDETLFNETIRDPVASGPIEVEDSRAAD